MQWWAEAQQSYLSRSGRSRLAAFSSSFTLHPTGQNSQPLRIVFHIQLLELWWAPIPFLEFINLYTHSLSLFGQMQSLYDSILGLFAGILHLFSLVFSFFLYWSKKPHKSYCFFAPFFCLLPLSNFFFPHSSYSHMPNHDILLCTWSPQRSSSIDCS